LAFVATSGRAKGEEQYKEEAIACHALAPSCAAWIVNLHRLLAQAGNAGSEWSIPTQAEASMQLVEACREAGRFRALLDMRLYREIFCQKFLKNFIEVSNKWPGASII
jgi:hypothetical protein